MRVAAWAEGGSADARGSRFGAASFGVLTVCLLAFAAGPGLAFDGSTPSAPAKISPKSFSSAEQALRAGIDDLNAGNAASSVEALTYAAEGGQPIARWKLGEMYADGIGVARDDVKAYQYFNQLVEDYDEDAPDQRNRGAISNAFVAVGVYCLTGIPNSDVRADPERARGTLPIRRDDFRRPGRAVQSGPHVHHRLGRSRQGRHRRFAMADAGGRKRATGHRRPCSATCSSPAKACRPSGRGG